MTSFKKYSTIITQLLLLLTLAGCHRKGAKQREHVKPRDSVEFQTNNITIKSYWNDYPFTDTIAIKNPNIAEQRFVNFLAQLPKHPLNEVNEGIESMLKQAEQNQKEFEFFKGQYEHYLADPNSPVRNDQYYEYVLAYLSQSRASSDTDRIRYKLQLEMIKKNQVGMQITDFSYLTSQGQIERLSDKEGNVNMLLFYDPTCPHCKEILNQLKSSSLLNKLISSKHLNVIAIDPLGDKKLWREYQRFIPSNWTNGFDHEDILIKKQYYSLHAYPTIYLLDKAGKILLKDPDYQLVLQILEKM